jgi:hypothetical protein
LVIDVLIAGKLKPIFVRTGMLASAAIELAYEGVPFVHPAAEPIRYAADIEHRPFMEEVGQYGQYYSEFPH